MLTWHALYVVWVVVSLLAAVYLLTVEERKHWALVWALLAVLEAWCFWQAIL